MNILKRIYRYFYPEPTVDVLARLIVGMSFQSETDIPLDLFVPTARRTGAVTSRTVEQLTGLHFVDYENFEQWFFHAIHTQPQGQRYEDLYEGMYETLGDRIVYKMRISQSKFAYYVIGVDSPIVGGNLLGIIATSVET